MRLLEILTVETLLDLVATHYWDRLWIIQEVVLTSRVRVLIMSDLWEVEDLHSVLAILESNITHPNMAKWGGVNYLVSNMEGRLKLWATQRSAPQDTSYQWIYSWHYVLALGIGTRCTILLDRVYGVMGLLSKDLRLHPDYTMSEKDVLKNIFRKQMAFINPELYIWRYLGNIIAVWDLEEGVFAPIIPAGSNLESNPRFFHSNDSAEQRLRMEHNVRCVLRELDIAIPAEMEALAPSAQGSAIQQHERSSVRQQ